jgi:hypothetical protein
VSAAMVLVPSVEAAVSAAINSQAARLPLQRLQRIASQATRLRQASAWQARLPLQDHRSTLAGELARFSREFPHNRFRVAPMGEAAASDMALVSGLISAGP